MRRERCKKLQSIKLVSSTVFGGIGNDVVRGHIQVTYRLKQLSPPLFRTLPVYATPLHMGESEKEAPTL